MKKRSAIQRRKLSILISGLLTMILIAGCASAGNSGKGNTGTGEAEVDPASKSELESLIKVRYNAFTGVSGLAVHFGAEKGFFKEEGLDVQFITTDNPVPGLTSGDIDIADFSTTRAIVAAGKGAPFKIVSSLFRTKGPFYLIAKTDIASVEDLKGKKVGGAVFGSGLDAYAQIILKEHRLSKEDVTYVANGVHDAAYASLTAGQVDATIIHEPFVSLAEKEGKGKLLAKGWDYLPNFHTGVLVASDSFIAKNPEAIEKLLRAYLKSQEYAKANLDEYKQYFSQHVKIDAEVLDAMFEREDVLWENNLNVDQAALQETQEIQVQLGFQEKVYGLEEILDLRFIPKQ
ncbi:ABC transporter substrate-binding protein [Paenibacillus sp. GXUN7292]|uniref:ABC transporter substrate-binding protein n=1 Tax=Paenibacillus sp. GXUN7292 TaxID=3422499 RepID=UPI003D7DEDF9